MKRLVTVLYYEINNLELMVSRVTAPTDETGLVLVKPLIPAEAQIVAVIDGSPPILNLTGDILKKATQLPTDGVV